MSDRTPFQAAHDQPALPRRAAPSTRWRCTAPAGGGYEISDGCGVLVGAFLGNERAKLAEAAPEVMEPFTVTGEDLDDLWLSIQSALLVRGPLVRGHATSVDAHVDALRAAVLEVLGRREARP